MSEPVTVAGLNAERERLEARLTEGWRRIDEAEGFGKDVNAWTDFWLTLLKEYESLCDRILDAA